ncbi:MAG: hypothetical protein GEU74_16430 [Nitriliruptorales bacterium]|nr:hypothetical protein [Nitriliruptorales bacterium]
MAVIAPFVVPAGMIGAGIVVALQATTVVVPLGATGAATATRWFTTAGALSILALGLAAGVAVVATGHGAVLLLDATRLLSLLLAAFVPVIIVRDVLAHPAISLQTVWAALCVYLLIGLAFAVIHLLIDRVAGHAYSRALDETGALYFSYVTLTTSGGRSPSRSKRCLLVSLRQTSTSRFAPG